MTTIVNNPGGGDSGGSGLIIGVIIAIVVLVIFFMYGLPAIRGNGGNKDGGTNINVSLPSPTSGGEATGNGGNQ